MKLPKGKELLLSSILLTLLMLVGAVLVAFDAMNIRHGEKIEEDTSRLLLNAEQWLGHQLEIELAAGRYLSAGTPESLAAIDMHRQEAQVHAQAMRNILDEYEHENAEARIAGLLAFAAGHQRKIDAVIALRKAGERERAASTLDESDSRLYLDGARLIIDNITHELQRQRTAANTRVSLNALRGSISFGLMALLMIAIIWISYAVATNAQRRSRELSEMLALKATHDALTGLPNRDLFYDRLSQLISIARRKRQHLGILLLDLDGFKVVNDTYGHQVGDATLKEAARRLRACVRDADTVARVGGDEFAIVLGELAAPQDARQVAEKIIRSIAEPMTLYGGQSYGIGVSIGIAIYPDHGIEIDRLVKVADHAMYESKRQGKNRFSFAAEQEGPGLASSDWVSFQDDFCVGVGIIDAQHQMLVDLLNRLNLSVARQAPQDVLFGQLDEIIAYTGVHFQTEEDLMATHDYPDAAAHREEHRRLGNEVKYLKTRFAAGGELLVLQWLKDWLVGHVAGSDRRLSEFLLERGVR